MRRLLPLPALLFVAAAPAAAAPVLEPLAPCYRSVPLADGGFDTEPVTVLGSRFTPGATVNVAVDGVDQERDVPVDGQGRIEGAVAAPGVATGERLFTVSATEPSNLAQSAVRQARVTVFGARITPRRASPRRTVRFRGTGFTDAGPVFAHYVRGGRARRTVRLARPSGDCGTFSVRRRQFPFAPASGRWRILLAQAREVDASVPTVTIAIRVRRTGSS